MNEYAEGQYYIEGSSQQRPANIRLVAGMIEVRTQDEQLECCSPSSCELSSPVGRLPYHIGFPGGASFECLDHKAIESFFTQRSSHKLIHRWEGSLRVVLLALLLMPAFAFVFLQYGMPFLAKQIAPTVPQELLLHLDEQVLESLDEEWLQPSQANDEEKALLSRAWQRLPQHEGLSLLSRSSPELGANAFALPGGHVIVTDELLRALNNENEILAVLAHESGHVYQYHGLRNIIQSLGVAAMLTAVVGDASWLAEVLLVSVPTVMQQMSYSRDLEREADIYSRRVLQEINVPSSCLGAGLAHLMASHEDTETLELIAHETEQETAQKSESPLIEVPNRKPPDPELSSTKKQEALKNKKELSLADETIERLGLNKELDLSVLSDYLQSHPGTEERIQEAGGLACPAPN